MDANRPRSDVGFVLPGGESTSAALRRVEQERDTAIKAAEICERALDKVSAKLTTTLAERDLARAELESARQELDAVRTARDNLARELAEACRRIKELETP